jgi:beta-galactosidase
MAHKIIKAGRIKHISKSILGPAVCTEYWVTWFTAWGGKKPQQNVPTVVDNIAHMYYSWNASFNIYVIHGGTNFGFMNGNSVI